MIDLLLCIAYILLIITALYYANAYTKIKNKMMETIEDNIKFIKSELKIKKLYRVFLTYKELVDKCPYCDEHRMITLTYPDGTTKKEPCSCKNQYKKEISVVEHGLGEREYAFAFSNKGYVRLYFYDDDWANCFTVIRNQKDYDKYVRKTWSQDLLFGSKALADKYAKHLKKEYKAERIKL